MQLVPKIGRRVRAVLKFKSRRNPGTEQGSRSEAEGVGLDVARVALKVTSGFIDGLNIPGLKGTIDAAVMILELVQVCLCLIGSVF